MLLNYYLLTTRPCAIYILYRKQQAGNIHIYNT